MPNRYGEAMFDPKLLDDLARKLAGNIPSDLQSLQDDLLKNLRRSLETGLSNLNLVTREEFDLQCAVLERSREKIRVLEQQIADLERALKERSSKDASPQKTSN